ncbi:MAG: DNA primase [Acidimicrobiales bacterium]
MREASDIVSIISERTPLKRVGTRYVGLCPFHAEKTPSLSVNAELGLYHCFGCQASGDVITFLRETHRASFTEVVETLAARAGIELTTAVDPERAERRRREDAALAALEAATEWYHQRLLTSTDARAARDYLKGRGIDGPVARRFRLGWAPESWDELVRALRGSAAANRPGAPGRRGVPERAMLDAGVAVRGRTGRLQDAFRGRVMFPIMSASGQAVAFGGRLLPPSGQGAGPPGQLGPKYKNSAETIVYSKRNVLYGLNWAKPEIVRAGEAIVCEGYTDVIGFFTAGAGRAVATCGTALAEGHAKVLSAYAKKLVLAYDADAAGQAGVSRVSEWEARYGFALFVIALPDGKDPDEVARADPDLLSRLVAEARPYLEFQLERLLVPSALSTAEGRAGAARACAALIAEHRDAMVRDQYLMRIAERCMMEPATLRRELERLRGRPARGQPPEVAADRGADGSSGPEEPVPRPELEGITLAVQQPGEAAGRLGAALFASPVAREAFDALESSDTLHEAIAAAGQAAAALLSRAAVEDLVASPDEVAERLVERTLRRALAGMGSMARAGRLAPAEAAAGASWLRAELDRLEGAGWAPDDTSRLLAWLVQWGLAEWGREKV